MQVPVPIQYKGVCIRVGYRIDLLVEEAVVVELKVVRMLHPVHEAQLLSYLKLSGCGVGLLINFNVTHLRKGVNKDGQQFLALLFLCVLRVLPVLGGKFASDTSERLLL
jgi:hypothetical protein